MAQDWYICISGKAIGPFSQDTLAFLIRHGRVRLDDFASGPGIAGWARLSALSPFSEQCAPTPSIPVPNPAAASKVSEVREPKPARSAPPKPIAVEEASTPVPPKGSEPAAQKHSWRVPIDAEVWLDGKGPYKVIDISEGGILAAVDDVKVNVGDDVKLQLKSASFAKPLEMTAVVVRREVEPSEKTIGLEFVRANPAHRRAIATYVKSRMGEE